MRQNVVVCVCMSMLALVSARVATATEAPVAVEEMNAVVPREFVGDLSQLPPVPAPPRPDYVHPMLRPPSMKQPPAEAAITAPAEALLMGPMPGPILNFAGMSKLELCGGVPCGSGWPPDTNGMAGDDHYIQAVNSSFAVYSKTGTLLASFTENQLWAGAGTPCDGNSAGDPIVIYDLFAKRWILTNFAFGRDEYSVPITPFYQCIAVSKTSDPVAGGWWLYPIQADAGPVPAGYLNDYPKFGIWNDCLYMAANEFTLNPDTYQGVMFASFSRADLVSGAPLTYAFGLLPYPANDVFTLIPSTAASRSPGSAPPPGTPNYYVNESGFSFDFLVRTFTPGPDCGAGGVLSAPTFVSQQPYDYNVNNVPQPNTVNTLDAIDDRLMQKVQYRRVGDTESLWVVHNVQDASEPRGTVRPQWAQLDVTGGVIATAPVQQQIYAPDTTLSRWMGSIATDRNGNAALGYSTSNGVVPNFPSISYAGRLAGDPLNQLPRTEEQLIAGGGSQANTCGGGPCQRWGDYSEMSIDPADDCTFWYTNEYYDTQDNGNVGNWQTRIGTFRFPDCIVETTQPVPALGPGAFAVAAVLLVGAGIVRTRWRRQ
ncbi:hypothetical protein L6Q96_11645 [Candidatus Binatia bacterium]|nr:hypothetical protein [Candidatus Binatia bacterium]